MARTISTKAMTTGTAAVVVKVSKEKVGVVETILEKLRDEYDYQVFRYKGAEDSEMFVICTSDPSDPTLDDVVHEHLRTVTHGSARKFAVRAGSSYDKAQDFFETYTVGKGAVWRASHEVEAEGGNLVIVTVVGLSVDIAQFERVAAAKGWLDTKSTKDLNGPRKQLDLTAEAPSSATQE